MVNHLAGHAAIDADVFAGNESGFVRTQVQYHIGDVHRISYAAGWVLGGIGSIIDRTV